MKIGIIREEKNPPDSRVPLTPTQVAELRKNGWDIVVQPSSGRCYADEEYDRLGIPMEENLMDRDLLLGVKEVPPSLFIPHKTYFIFSHTIKEQPYNKPLIRQVLEKKVTLIDYEVLTDNQGARVIAFGKYAGMVGAHNALWTYGQKTGSFQLPRMHTLTDYAAATEVYKKTTFNPLKIVLTGTGRVATGSAQVLGDMGIEKVRPIDFVTKDYNHPVYTQLNSFYYAKRKDGSVFDDVQDFYTRPEKYDSDFDHFISVADIMINGIYWDTQAPAFFTTDQMKRKDFNIQVISDVTCDIAPESSIPSTLKASTIADPVFGYDPMSEGEVPAFSQGCIDMMTIDNLPNELPRDASQAFGQMFIDHVLPELLRPESKMIEKATIALEGDLGPHFQYLKDYASI